MTPPGKLALLYDLERVRELIRGAEPFHPDRDRAAFARFLIDSGAAMTPGRSARGRDAALAPQYLIDATSPKEITMRDIATATLSGNLTREVELRQLPSGTDLARMRIATIARRRNGEEWVDRTNYFTVEAYGGQARACAEYLRKGSRVFVDAELDWREWTDKQDNKREAVTFRARQVLFEGGRAVPAASADGGEQRYGAVPEAAALPDGEPVGASTPGADGSASADDLPF